MGAEKLLGKGDMLFMLPGAVPLKRVHGAFVSDQEVQRVVQSLKNQCAPSYDEAIVAACEKALTEETGSSGDGSGGGEAGTEEDFDPFYDKAVELVVEKGQASTSMIQRAFRIGYNRAARIIEMMEREGVVSKMDGVRPREILAPAMERIEPN
jgi:S-DNA-T family DNA segregation ATPase FtsK/SpoIIIE